VGRSGVQDGPRIAHQVLGGWSLTPIVTIRTGTPYTIFDGPLCTRSILWRRQRAGLHGCEQDPAPYTGAGSAPMSSFTWAAVSLVSSPNPTYFLSDLPPYPSNMTSRNAFRGPGFWMLIWAFTRPSISPAHRLQDPWRVLNLLTMRISTWKQHGRRGVWHADSRMQGLQRWVQDRRNVQLAAKIIF